MFEIATAVGLLTAYYSSVFGPMIAHSKYLAENDRLHQMMPCDRSIYENCGDDVYRKVVELRKLSRNDPKRLQALQDPLVRKAYLQYRLAETRGFP